MSLPSFLECDMCNQILKDPMLISCCCFTCCNSCLPLHCPLCIGEINECVTFVNRAIVDALIYHSDSTESYASSQSSQSESSDDEDYKFKSNQINQTQMRLQGADARHKADKYTPLYFLLLKTGHRKTLVEY